MMLVSTTDSQLFVRGKHPVVPTFSLEQVLVVISEGDGEETIDDAIVKVLSGPTVDNNLRILSDSFARTAFESATPDVGMVDANGYVQRIVDGTVKVIARTGPNVQSLPCPVSRTTPPSAFAFVAWAPGSLAKFAFDTVTDATSGVTASASSRAIFSGTGRNPTLFCGAYADALTAVAKTTAGSSWYGQTAITRRHIVGAKHAPSPSGKQIVFTTGEGVDVARTVTHTYDVPEIDVRVGVLNSDLSEGIVPMPVAPPTIGDFLRNPQYGVPLMFADRNNWMNVVLSQSISDEEIRVSPPQGDLLGFYTFPVDGTSGKQVMLPWSSTELAMLMPFSYPNRGPALHACDWVAVISTADAVAGISTGYLPRIADFSAFTFFEA